LSYPNYPQKREVINKEKKNQKEKNDNGAAAKRPF